MEFVPFNRTLQVCDDVDVLVVGAGPAGICAGISAARGGAKTLVIDQYGCVGGAATVNCVGPFMTCYDAKNEYMIIKGLFSEVLERMKALGGAIDPALVEAETSRAGFYKIGHAHVGPFDHECYKRVCTDMILESGARLLLYTQFVDVITDDGRVEGVAVCGKDGLRVIRSKVIVDCTGDGDVAVRAGAKFELGRVEDGNMQPATLFFRVYNVDSKRLAEHIREHRDEIKPFYGPFSWLIREKAEQWGDVPRAEVCLFEGVNEGEYRLNVTRILDVDGTKADDLTRAEIEGIRQAHKVFDFLKKYAVGFENAVIMDTAPAVGIRETRHIDGIKRLTADDVKACSAPGDTIAVMATNMDTHNKSDPGGTYFTLQNGRYFGVPYGCLVPRGIENMLVAGRSISSDAVAGSAIRMIPCCMAFGQAAGTAAAMAIKEGITPDKVDTSKLRAELVRQGAYLGEA
ncbi:MAG: FAD-dependent oxidoreductase [Clostridia bacterium]|nr:FAD-dependent oxidoreductase [Clostridia bacterium]